MRSRLNLFFHARLRLPERDYYGELDPDSLAELKSVLGDINNIFTLKVCMAFAKWLGTSLKLSEFEVHEIESAILSKKPSANGFDVEVAEPVSVIVEIKCNVPINQGTVYGSAQRNGIAKDLDSLLNGKSRSKVDPVNSLKFFVLLDTPNIRKATEHFFRNRPEFRENIEFASPSLRPSRRDVVYVVYVSPVD